MNRTSIRRALAPGIAVLALGPLRLRRRQRDRRDRRQRLSSRRPLRRPQRRRRLLAGERPGRLARRLPGREPRRHRQLRPGRLRRRPREVHQRRLSLRRLRLLPQRRRGRARAAPRSAAAARTRSRSRPTSARSRSSSTSRASTRSTSYADDDRADLRRQDHQVERPGHRRRRTRTPTCPTTTITPVHRSDESGTTKNFTDYLEQGRRRSLDLRGRRTLWPIKGGEAAEGTSGVVAAVTGGKGTIGYADAEPGRRPRRRLGQGRRASTSRRPPRVPPRSLEVSPPVEGRADDRHGRRDRPHHHRGRRLPAGAGVLPDRLPDLRRPGRGRPGQGLPRATSSPTRASRPPPRTPAPRRSTRPVAEKAAGHRRRHLGKLTARSARCGGAAGRDRSPHRRTANCRSPVSDTATEQTPPPRRPPKPPRPRRPGLRRPRPRRRHRHPGRPRRRLRLPHHRGLPRALGRRATFYRRGHRLPGLRLAAGLRHPPRRRPRAGHRRAARHRRRPVRLATTPRAGSPGPSATWSTCWPPSSRRLRPLGHRRPRPALVPLYDWLDDAPRLAPVLRRARRRRPAARSSPPASCWRSWSCRSSPRSRREIFPQTPRLHEEAALALGATRWEMIRLAVFPYARSGMVSAVDARPRPRARRDDGRRDGALRQRRSSPST